MNNEIDEVTLELISSADVTSLFDLTESQRLNSTALECDEIENLYALPSAA